MSALEQSLGGPAIEVVAKATRRRFTMEYKRKIVREADACKTPAPAPTEVWINPPKPRALEEVALTH